MKRTEMEKIERGVKRVQKRESLAQKRDSTIKLDNIASYIDRLHGLFRYDDNEIFNTREDIEILELLDQMQSNISSKKWNDILKKAIKKTAVRERDKALFELQEFLSSEESCLPSQDQGTCTPA